MTTSYLNSAIETISNDYDGLIPQITTLLLVKDIAEKDSMVDEELLLKI